MSILGKFFAAEAVLGKVTNSVEFQRIYALPRRFLDLESFDDVTPVFEKSGELHFWPIQSAALIEAAICDGLFAPIGVGHGKTLVGLALPTAMDSERAVYLVKPDLKRQLEREMRSFYGKHFDLPLDKIRVVSYSELSSAKTATILEEIEPDLIIADEAHCLKRKESARTKRFLRYMKEHPECRFAALSGTMTTRSIQEYAHLIELALRKNSPLPRGYRELNDWSGALDVKPQYKMAPGILTRFCEEGEDVRSGFRRRLVETQGVVSTEEGSVSTSLIIRRLSMPTPPQIKELMGQVQKEWRIDEEELTDITEFVRVMKQISLGFYYRWDWPDGEPDVEWLEARRNWNREVREKLKYAKEGMDSPYLLQVAAEKGLWHPEHWLPWKAVKDRPPPPTVPEWRSDFVVDAAVQWAKKQTAPAIIWYEWQAMGERIAEKSGFPYYPAGTDASESKCDVIVASVRAQGTGKNLQHYCRNLLTSMPPNGTTFEQLAGRTHRPGQLADEVTIDWYGHTPQLEDSFARVIDDAEYMEGTTGQRQKVLYATRL